MTPNEVTGVVLAAVGAVLFGLASVRQHGAVQETMSAHHSVAESVQAFGRLIREPSWLRGAVETVVGSGMHVVALALAPITLVQPVGVIAVPITVAAAALRSGRRPTTSHLLGSALSVVGIGALTVLLIVPPAHPVILPRWGSVVAVLSVPLLVAVLAALLRRVGPPLLRCIALASTAAMLFALNAVLIRLLGHLVRTGSVQAASPVLLTSALAIGVALPVGLWTMQSAYLSGSPHVAICCLTLIDPVTAVVGGHLLLRDGVEVGRATLAVALCCALVAAARVLLLSRDYPVDQADS